MLRGQRIRTKSGPTGRETADILEEIGQRKKTVFKREGLKGIERKEVTQRIPLRNLKDKASHAQEE